MPDDLYKRRKNLTFAQAENVAPLPRQLALQVVSSELRALLWHVVFGSMLQSVARTDGFPVRRYLDNPWGSILYEKHVHRDHKMADEFINSYPELMEDVKRVFLLGDYVAIFDFLQWLLQRKSCPIKPVAVKAALETAGAAYRLLDDNRTIVPISTEEEKESLDHAFADLSASEFAGARSHLAKAANALTSGKAADSIRESINAVESVARTLGGTNSLSGALNSLKAKNSIHPALEKSFSTLYGFTSDERGIRHPLLEADKANVNEVDAIFMIGACASFVSYLINKSR